MSGDLLRDVGAVAFVGGESSTFKRCLMGGAGVYPRAASRA